jgi:hypothetical protein
MIRFHTFTEPGGHAVNEDAFLAQQHPADAGLWLCFLADGQGGRAGGARAAQLACQAALAAALHRPAHALAEPAAWPLLLGEADAAVAADRAAGFTTLIGFCLTEQALCGASSGDSAVLALDGTDVREPTRHQLKDPPVGSGEALFVPFAQPLALPWRVLAMSDGVWKYAGWERITVALWHEGGEALLAALQAAARLPGSGRFPDDFTVVLFEPFSFSATSAR